MLWLWILLGVLTALSWVGVFFPGYPWWIAAIVTGVVVIVVVTVIVVRRVQASRRAAALEKELLRQAGAHAEHARPDRRAEILQLQAQMKDAIAALKKSKLGVRGGQSALYALPWYVIVGPPASGKTTALEQSGLAFVGPGGGAPKVRGTAGTKNCDWWFSKDAILLDTAGRFAVNEDDPEEWFAFLDTVKRFRTERPLDGIIVAVSLAELMSAGDSQIEELATKLRARIEEVLTRFEMVLPIYVMFTKTDLVAGFVEFWSDLGKQQRGQVWGATFLIDDERLQEPQAAFEAEFDELAEALHARLVDRLPRERMPETRARTLQFPVEFQSLKPVLGRFIDELCKPNPYQDAPIVRGFYFTSGTQVGRPLDRVLSGMVQGFNLRPGLRADRPPAQTASYFVTDLFKTIIFPDRHVAIRSSSRVRRGLRKQFVYMAAAFLLTLVIVIPAVLSYLDNSDLVNATGKQVTEVLRVGQEKGQGSIGTSLDPLLSRTQELEAAKAAFNVPWWWGPYSADTLYGPVHGFYVDRLRTVFEGPVQERIVEDVNSVADLAKADEENFLAAYNDVRIYVMMLEPEHIAADWAAERLAAKWAAVSNVEADPGQLKVHAKYYVDAVAKDHSLAWTPNGNALTRARNRLMLEQLEELQFRRLIKAIGEVPAIRPGHIFKDRALAYMDAPEGVLVPGVYTKLGWEKAKVVLDAEDSALELEPWVLGMDPGENSAKLASVERVRAIYFAKYARAWRDFLQGMTVKAPTDVRGAVDELRTLSDSQGPYARLFKSIVENGKLDMSPPGLLGKAVGKGKEALSGVLDKAKGAGVDAGAVKERLVSPVERDLRPLIQFGAGDGTPAGAAQAGLAQYLKELSDLSVDLGMLLDSGREPSGPFQEKLAITAGFVEKLLVGFDSQSRAILEPLLMNPIRGSRTGVAGTVNLALNEKWKAEVWQTYSEKIAPRYPFNEGSQSDVTIAEFTEFFRPNNGTLWTFFNTSLADRLVRAGTTFTPKSSADQVPFTGAFLQCLQTAQVISDAVFGAGAEPIVPFQVRLEPAGSEVSEVNLSIDGQAIVYRNEPERPFAMQWPGKGPNRGGILKVVGAGFTDTTQRGGDFGWFRLLTFGGLRPVSGGGLVASYPLSRSGQPPVTITIRPDKSAHPFGEHFFARLNCPPAIMGGGAPTVAPR